MKKFLLQVQAFAGRYHLLWVLFYTALLSVSFAFASQLYHEYDEDQLPDGYIELLVSKDTYQLGEPVEFTVVNHFPTTIYVTNHCPEEPLNVYRWEQDRWVQIHDVTQGGDETCRLQERNVAVPPEGVRSYDFTDWPNLFAVPGVYRIAMVVDHYHGAPFQDFVVLEPPQMIEVMEAYRPQPVVPVAAPVTPLPVVVETVVEEVIVEEPEEVYEEEDEYEEEDDEREYEREEEEDDD